MARAGNAAAVTRALQSLRRLNLTPSFEARASLRTSPKRKPLPAQASESTQSIAAAKKRLPPLPPSQPTIVTTLDNGLRVATQESPGHFVAAGVYIDTGTRYETDETAGASHILDRMSFKSTKDLPTEELVSQLEKLGGNVIAHSSREAVMYQAAVFRHDLPKVMQIFSQVINHPLLLPNELDETRTTTMYEIAELSQKPEMMLPEVLHGVAFNSNGSDNVNTLGRPLLCPAEVLDHITPDTLRKFKDTWYTPNRMVVAGVGMDHAMMVDLATKYFGSMPKTSPELLETQQKLSLPATYTGGIQILDTTNDPPHANPDVRPLTHVYIAFEALSMSDPDIYALATLTSLMGGGGAFSAGGPGKGMYTRLYTNVLNRYWWVEQCNMVSYSYLDTGLFGITASVPPSEESHAGVLPVLLDQLVWMTTMIREDELSRAKNQLKSSLLMSLESKVLELEDIGRQVMVHGRRLSVNEMIQRIEDLTVDDLIRVARRMVLGEDTPSPLAFDDGWTKPWVRTGNGSPTVLIQGPVGERDPLRQAEAVLKDWGVGRYQVSGTSSNVNSSAAGKKGLLVPGLSNRQYSTSSSSVVSTGSGRGKSIHELIAEKYKEISLDDDSSKSK
ncbi:hypothetical protein SmJEL517_g05767 [Synchytrium microbalum]|uniref:Alpha-MPP n=1 Tax=Synchytrium microbalum TaxID=1806994 RepID=A0A507BSW9_9FUNG|nr:uncharacterized protein SmJEL517_g05767 [Synchytrium microbalum]TPX30742.1 hypothetical protein SmJEL517_g05767 [Synchytrium microbalum]